MLGITGRISNEQNIAPHVLNLLASLDWDLSMLLLLTVGTTAAEE